MASTAINISLFYCMDAFTFCVNVLKHIQDAALEPIEVEPNKSIGDGMCDMSKFSRDQKNKNNAADIAWDKVEQKRGGRAASINN
jgi:hypothetical protein